MTDNSRKVFDFLKSTTTALTAQDIADRLGVTVPTVTGSVNGLVKKGLAVREEQNMEVDGKAAVVKFIKLTSEGRSFDPDAATA